MTASLTNNILTIYNEVMHLKLSGSLVNIFVEICTFDEETRVMPFPVFIAVIFT
jgi:hypothetical protein